MRPYKRAGQKRKGLISVKNYTNLIRDEYDEPDSIQNGRETEGRTLFDHRKDDGERRHHPGRCCPAHGSAAIQHQQSDAGEVPGDSRFSVEDGRVYRARCGIEDSERQDLDAGGSL